ncbi:MAG: hypothetical protein AAB404_02575 [Patescibacteria group bacterium]
MNSAVAFQNQNNFAPAAKFPACRQAGLFPRRPNSASRKPSPSGLRDILQGDRGIHN